MEDERIVELKQNVSRNRAATKDYPLPKRHISPLRFTAWLSLFVSTFVPSMPTFFALTCKQVRADRNDNLLISTRFSNLFSHKGIRFCNAMLVVSCHCSVTLPFSEQLFIDNLTRPVLLAGRALTYWDVIDERFEF